MNLYRKILPSIKKTLVSGSLNLTNNWLPSKLEGSNTGESPSPWISMFVFFCTTIKFTYCIKKNYRYLPSKYFNYNTNNEKKSKYMFRCGLVVRFDETLIRFNWESGKVFFYFEKNVYLFWKDGDAVKYVTELFIVRRLIKNREPSAKFRRG